MSPGDLVKVSGFGSGSVLSVCAHDVVGCRQVIVLQLSLIEDASSTSRRSSICSFVGV